MGKEYIKIDRDALERKFENLTEKLADTLFRRIEEVIQEEINDVLSSVTLDDILADCDFETIEVLEPKDKTPEPDAQAPPIPAHKTKTKAEADIEKIKANMHSRFSHFCLGKTFWNWRKSTCGKYIDVLARDITDGQTSPPDAPKSMVYAHFEGVSDCDTVAMMDYIGDREFDVVQKGGYLFLVLNDKLPGSPPTTKACEKLCENPTEALARIVISPRLRGEN